MEQGTPWHRSWGGSGWRSTWLFVLSFTAISADMDSERSLYLPAPGVRLSSSSGPRMPPAAARPRYGTSPISRSARAAADSYSSSGSSTRSSVHRSGARSSARADLVADRATRGRASRGRSFLAWTCADPRSSFSVRSWAGLFHAASCSIVRASTLR